MTKFATGRAATATKITTAEGGTGFVREPKAELYVTAVSTLVENTTYETGDERTTRLVDLVRQVTKEDPEWVLRFITWLRAEANMRSVAVLVACEFVKARLDAKLSGMNRQAIKAACLRADEPGEVIAYWQGHFGRNLPKPVKRGLSDAARELFTERAALRYDGNDKAIRLGDVVELVHPESKGPVQSALYGYLLDRRHGRRPTPDAVWDALPAIVARRDLNAMTVADRHAFARRVMAGDVEAEKLFSLALAGQWEWGKSWLGQDSEDETFERLTDAEQWELFVPYGLGFMAMLRNLRNFDKAGISEEMVTLVKGRLIDKDEVVKSRQLPLRFLSAYKATGGNHWDLALSMALEYSLANVPELPGRTLVLVDQSGSMFHRVSERSEVEWSDQAALFGTALALRGEDVTLVQFGTSSAQVPLDRTKTVLQHMDKFGPLGGTQTMDAVRRWFSGHDRIVIVTDEQSHYDRSGATLGTLVPDEVPVYTWNLAGYRVAHGEAAPNRVTFAGLTDGAFALIPLLERGMVADYPF